MTLCSLCVPPCVQYDIGVVKAKREESKNIISALMLKHKNPRPKVSLLQISPFCNGYDRRRDMWWWLLEVQQNSQENIEDAANVTTEQTSRQQVIRIGNMTQTSACLFAVVVS